MPNNLPPLAVTGATGALGSMVARLLTDAGVPVRLLARHTAKIPQLPDTATFAVSYADKEHAARALQGTTTLFMVSAAENPYRAQDQRTFVDAAKEAGVQHIVYTSFMGAAPNDVFTFGRDHWDTEEYIKAGGFGYTFLRDSFYQDILPSFVGRDGVIRGPAGDGRFAPVARSDVARSAARILMAPQEHAGRTYTLTGPQALTMAEVAEILSRVTGQDITYHAETLKEAVESRRAAGALDWQAVGWATSYAVIATGELAQVSDDVALLTGAAPLSFEDHLRSED
ncbi:SDR family oxidoreductase [Arthrobacter sp. Edens01]|uniref:SDR family oxidoreductase n=1 Tax=Arthrobacter sp. Edens01 TaxID=1732020 RepID=UPI0006DA7F44|nr:SDR family oxidoreductase [Arthrobacter sp. Edens01]KPN18884.1 nucleoside-diphosphate sugar epimerase [Arthrobacter sp. Edens01]